MKYHESSFPRAFDDLYISPAIWTASKGAPERAASENHMTWWQHCSWWHLESCELPASPSRLQAPVATGSWSRHCSWWHLGEGEVSCGQREMQPAASPKSSPKGWHSKWSRWAAKAAALQGIQGLGSRERKSWVHCSWSPLVADSRSQSGSKGARQLPIAGKMWWRNCSW